MEGFVDTVHLFAADTPDIAHYAAFVDGFDLLQKNDRKRFRQRSEDISSSVASCKATLEVEITIGSFIRSGRCICQRIQPTR